MANKKISQMGEITTLAVGDYFPFIDISQGSAANKNKRTTYYSLANNLGFMQLVTQTTHGFAAKDLIRMDSGTELWTKSLADTTAHAVVDGIVLSVVDANNFYYTGSHGALLGGFGAVFAAGVKLYLSAVTAGAMTSTPPTIERHVATGITESQMIFHQNASDGSGGGGADFSDAAFSVYNDADVTKLFQIDLSGTTTAKYVRFTFQNTDNNIIYFPNVTGSDTVVMNNTAAVITNKTIDTSSVFADQSDNTKQLNISLDQMTTGKYVIMQFNNTDNGTFNFPNVGAGVDTVMLNLAAAQVTEKTFDTTCEFNDSTDNTKYLRLDLSGMTTLKAATLFFENTLTRSYTFPDASGYLVMETTSQNLSNKALDTTTCYFYENTKGIVKLNVTGSTLGEIATLDFNHTAARTYTFPDVSGNIMLGAGADDCIAIFSGSEAIAHDVDLAWDSTNNALTFPVWKPVADGTTALKIVKNNGTTVVATFDTTNSRFGINRTPTNGNLELQVNTVAYQPTNGFLMYNSAVAHGITTFAPTSCISVMQGIDATGGGLEILGMNSSATIAANMGVRISGVLVTETSSDLLAPFIFRGITKSGTSGTSVSTGKKVCEFVNWATGIFSLWGDGKVLIMPTASANQVPTYSLSFGGNTAKTIGLERHTTANTSGNNLTINAGGATSGATDKNGGTYYNIPGVSTGTGMAAYIVKSNRRAATTGTSDNSQDDRFIVPSEVNLTDGVAVSLFEIALPTLTMASGNIIYGIEATDGTDMQTHSGKVTFSVVNKGGVYTKQITDDTAVTDSKAVSVGTLDDTWTILEGTNKVTIQLSVNTSLTPTSMKLFYVVHNDSKQAVTLL